LRVAPPGNGDEPLAPTPPTAVGAIAGLPLAEIVLDAILQNPHGGPAAAVNQIAARISPAMQLHYVKEGASPPPPPEGSVVLSHAIRVGEVSVATLHLMLPRD